MIIKESYLNKSHKMLLVNYPSSRVTLKNDMLDISGHHFVVFGYYFAG